MTTPKGSTRTGVVAAFDDPRGLGTVVDDDGSRYDFHCTAVADGSRTVAVGAEITFILAPGHRGLMEAADIQPRGATPVSAVPPDPGRPDSGLQDLG